jgi:mevalonate kinase
MKPNYCSKVLLLGEYSMIFDSSALLIPLQMFSAEWIFDETRQDEKLLYSNRELHRFCQYLDHEESLKKAIDTDSFARDLTNGLALASNVPMGYGLGSSGTVVAAVYDRYAKEKSDDFLELKGLFARMESFYHGSSSGIDPIACYTGKPFRISADKIVILPDEFICKDIHICLIDTKIAKNTKPLVEYFKQQREDASFLQAFQSEYLPYVVSCMDTLTEGNMDEFFVSVKQLSKAQLRFFRPMIPDSFIPLFAMNHDFRFAVKLLGAGGGGYMLGFCDEKTKASELLKEYDVLWI